MVLTSPVIKKTPAELRGAQLRSYIQGVEKRSRPGFSKAFRSTKQSYGAGTKVVILDPKDPIDRTTIQFERMMNDHRRRGQPENIWGSSLRWINDYGKPKPKIIYKIKGRT